MSDDEALYQRLRDRTLDATDTDTDVARLLSRLPKIWKVERRSEHVIAPGDAPNWLEFESLTWELGEKLRQALLENKKWKKSEPIHKACIDIVLDAELKHGRQPYLELIGKYGGENAKRAILGCLDDDAVRGHAVEAARLAGVTEAVDRIRDILANEKRAWIRKEAKKYLAKHG